MPRKLRRRAQHFQLRYLRFGAIVLANDPLPDILMDIERERMARTLVME